jgi:hypothetical protein
MLKDLTHFIIVYNPGYAGNFLVRLFSLGTEVMPQIPLISLNDTTLDSYNTAQRTELYSFSKVRNSYSNWQKFHKKWLDFQHYDNIDNMSFTDNYTHVMFAMHAPELELYLNKIQSIEKVNYFYVDLDLEKYGSWLDSSRQDLNFKNRVDEDLKYNLLLDNSTLDQRINLTAMLDSKNEFLQEYRRVCAIMNITPMEESAVLLYDGWHDTRVTYYSST